MRFGTANRRAIALVALVVLLSATGCATLAPGVDPVVVRTEQTLSAAPAVYDAALTWAEENKATLPTATLKVFEQIRVGFPPLYRATDSALQLYKAKKTNNLANQSAELERMVGNLISLVAALGGPNLAPGGAQ